jgi:hypothetical protein
MRYVLVAMALVAAGCTAAGRSSGSPGPGNPGSFPLGSFGAQCSGQATALTGTALAPNGTDPVAAAYVYVVDQAAAIAPGVACDVCGGLKDTSLVQVVGGPDGRFSLNLDQLPKTTSVKLVVAKGRFRRVTDVPVVACSSTPVPPIAVTLPGRSSDGDIPKIAVATGDNDHLDVTRSASASSTATTAPRAATRRGATRLARRARRPTWPRCSPIRRSSPPTTCCSSRARRGSSAR